MAADFAAGCIGGMYNEYSISIEESYLIELRKFRELFSWYNQPGAAGIAVGFPLDTVKVRIQTQDISKGVKYKSTFGCLATIIREEGVCII